MISPCYGMFLIPPSTDKSSGVWPLPLKNSPNSLFFLWQTSRYVKMDTRLQSRCRGCNPFSPSSRLFPRAGQPRGQGDGDPHSGAPAAREEQADAGAADETPGHVG